MRLTRRRTMTVAAAATLAVIVGATTAACGNSESGAADEQTITVYNAQHDDLTQAEADAFTAQTGIKVTMRNGDDSEMSNQIVQEGSASPADVFLTENSPGMSLVDSKGLFAKVDKATLDQVPAQYSPADGNWVGWAARSTVLPYNTTKLTPQQLPASIMDLAQPQWKGKIGVSPSGADFQAIVSAVVQLKGEDAAAAWLKGLKDNAKIYKGNTSVMKAVNAGEIDAGVIYHYYWYKDQAENGANSKNVQLKYFGNADPGAFVSVSGAGVLKSSKHQEAAQKFVNFLTSTKGQQILSDSTALEYSIASGVPANAKLKPLTELNAPKVDVAALNGPRVVALMQQTGLI